MIDRQNIFDQAVKIDLRTYDSNHIIVTGWGVDYTTICLLNYSYFNECYKMIPSDTLRWTNVDLMSILRQYIKNKKSTNSCVILTYFSDAILIGEKPTSLWHTFFDETIFTKDSQDSQLYFWRKNL